MNGAAKTPSQRAYAEIQELFDGADETLTGMALEQYREALGEALRVLRAVDPEADAGVEHTEGRIYAPSERLVWEAGDVTVQPPEVEYDVRDAAGRVIEIVLKDGTRLYVGDSPER